MMHSALARIAPIAASLSLLASTSAPGLAAAPTAEPDASAARSSYEFEKAETIVVESSNGVAAGMGQVKWFHGHFPRGYIHRADYSDDAKIISLHPVGCIWAKVTFGYPLGSLTVGPGGPAGGVSPGEYDNGFYVSCRTGQGYNRDYPRPLSLAGIGYPKALLNSTTLWVCTSDRKADGPRYCGLQKMVY